jgi:hypothetical protein
MSASTANTLDPVPRSAFPSFQRVTTPAPSMPSLWTATVLLHPFSPPLSSDSTPDNPFFQLCVASIVYSQGQYFSAQVSGCSYGNWWYLITSAGTQIAAAWSARPRLSACRSLGDLVRLVGHPIDPLGSVRGALSNERPYRDLRCAEHRVGHRFREPNPLLSR